MEKGRPRLGQMRERLLFYANRLKKLATVCGGGFLGSPGKCSLAHRGTHHEFPKACLPTGLFHDECLRFLIWLQSGERPACPPRFILPADGGIFW